MGCVVSTGIPSAMAEPHCTSSNDVIMDNNHSNIQLHISNSCEDDLSTSVGGGPSDSPQSADHGPLVSSADTIQSTTVAPSGRRSVLSTQTTVYNPDDNSINVASPCSSTSAPLLPEKERLAQVTLASKPALRWTRGAQGGAAEDDESSLSDISSTTISTGGVSPRVQRGRTSSTSSAGYPMGYPQVIGKGEDLEQQRLQAPLSIEEDLFCYSDFVISKDEARSKHWRLVGRKPTLAPTPGGGVDPTAPPGAGGRRSNSFSKSGSFFSFNDFAVCVDEMDLGSLLLAPTVVPTPPLDRPPTAPQAGLGDGTPGSGRLGGAPANTFSVTSVVAMRDNTVAHHMLQRRQQAPKSNRPLKKFYYDTILGHATRVKCIALTPSERDFASCSNEDASVALSNLGVHDEVGIFTGHQDTVINACFSPDGKYLATTSKDRTMILWDVMTTKQLLTFSHAKVVICCCFSPDSKYLVSGCQDRICRLWDTRRGKEWLTYSHHEGIIIAVAFSPDGGHVCSASADKTLRVWSSTTGKTRFTLQGHVGIILSCSYTSDGKFIVSNDESLLRVWSTADGSCTLSITPADITGRTHLSAKGPKLGWTLSAAAPGSFTGYLLVACNNRHVYVLNVKTGAEVTRAFCKAPVYCLTTGTNELAACGDNFGNIYMLHMA